MIDATIGQRTYEFKNVEEFNTVFKIYNSSFKNNDELEDEMGKIGIEITYAINIDDFKTI